MNKWLMLLAILLLSGCTTAIEPAISPPSNGNSSSIDSSSSSVDMVYSSSISQIEESNINYAFPFIEEKDWEQGDYKINVGESIEERMDYNQNMIFTLFTISGEQNYGYTSFPMLEKENSYLTPDTSPDPLEVTINGSVEVGGNKLWTLMNGFYAVWEFHSEIPYSEDQTTNYHTQYYMQKHSFTLLNEVLHRNETQLDLNALKDARTLPATVSWNPLSEQYIIVYGVGDPVYRHIASEYGMEGDDIFTSESKRLGTGYDPTPIYQLAVATFDGQGKLLKQLTFSDRYLHLFTKFSMTYTLDIQILSDHEYLLYRSNYFTPKERDGNGSDDWLYFNLETGKTCIIPELSGDIRNFTYNTQTRELLTRNGIYLFSEDGTSESRRHIYPKMKLEEQDGKTMLVPAEADNEKDAFKNPITVPYSAVRDKELRPIKIPEMPMLNKTDLYYSVEKDDLILLMKYPWAQLEKAEVVYGFQYCSDKCNIEFTYVDQDGTVYIKHKHD